MKGAVYFHEIPADFTEKIISIVIYVFKRTFLARSGDVHKSDL